MPSQRLAQLRAKPGHAQATNSFLVQQLADKVKEQPFYCPVDIVKDIQCDISDKILYATTFRVKQYANEGDNGTHKSAYLALLKYCQDIELNNPNKVAILEKTSENKFYCIFIYYSASAISFTNCRPLLSINSTHLKHKYQGLPVLIIANNRHPSGYYCC